MSEDPGRIIYDAEEKLKTAHATIDRLRTELEQSQGVRTSLAAEIERLKADWQSEFTAAQQLRSEVAQLEQLLDETRDNLRVLEADGTAMDHHCEGMKAAFLAVIKTFVEASR